ncbi:MAG: hypothetical protein V2A73_20560 [Pseudomonadota bacterium]
MSAAHPQTTPMEEAAAHSAHTAHTADTAHTSEHAKRVLRIVRHEPTVRTVALDREPMGFLGSIYLWEILKGVAITAHRFCQNFFLRKLTATVQYPD